VSYWQAETEARRPVAMIRQVGRDGGVQVNSPERRPAKGQSRAASLLREAQHTEEEMQSIHATLEAMEAAVGVSAQSASAVRTQRSYMSQQVERRSREIVETQEFLAEMRARIEELSETQIVCGIRRSLNLRKIVLDLGGR
jgi:chromosome segregation ATPase